MTPVNDLAAADVDDITTSFTGMKLQNPGNAFKRSADRMTVEGSPICNSAAHSNAPAGDISSSEEDGEDLGPAVHAVKRIDLNPTPVRKPDSLNAANTGKSDVVRIHNLLVISSGSDDHNTGDHQENALRTALLAGENGCLRREPLRPYVTWLEPEAVAPAPIADLLRVHDFTYIRHLQEKCRTSSGAAAAAAMPTFYAPPGKLDSDTPLVESSLDASRRFCGAAMTAVDKVNQLQSTPTLACALQCANSRRANIYPPRRCLGAPFPARSSWVARQATTPGPAAAFPATCSGAAQTWLPAAFACSTRWRSLLPTPGTATAAGATAPRGSPSSTLTCTTATAQRRSFGT